MCGWMRWLKTVRQWGGFKTGWKAGPGSGDHWHKAKLEASNSQGTLGVNTGSSPVIFITDLHEERECPLSKFAGDKEPGGDADMPEECAAIQRDLEGWINEMTGTSRSSTSTKSCRREGTTPGISSCWGLPSWKADWQKRTCRSWWKSSWIGARKVPLPQRLMISWAASDKLLPAGWGRWSFPSPQHWWGHTWSFLYFIDVNQDSLMFSEKSLLSFATDL